MRCAIYIRVSTDREEQKSSLVNQKSLFEKYIQDKGWDIYDFYVDIESGTKSKRENLLRLIKDVQDKKVDIILAKELSRLARNGALSYEIRDIAEENKVHIVTLDNAINTLEGNTDKFGLYAWLYEQESNRISIRMKSTFKTISQNGFFKGSCAPYGYHMKDKKLYINDDNTVNIVKRIFKDYLSGKGFDRIARELFEEDVLTPATVAGKSNASEKWQGSSVRSILENPHYTGDLVQGRTETVSVTSKRRYQNSKEKYIVSKNTHEAIITKNDFEAVQQLIKSRKRIRPQQTVHLFTNILFCDDCSHGMHFKKNRRGYICGNFNKHGKKACTDHIVIETDLANAILTDIKFMLSNIKNEKVIADIEKKVIAEKKKLEKEFKSYSKDMGDLKIQKNKATSKFINDEISKSDYDTFKSEIDIKIKELSEKEQKYKAYIAEKYDASLLSELEELKEKVIDLKVLTPELLNRFVGRIIIKTDGTPKVFYRFSESSIYFSAFFSNAQHSTCAVCGTMVLIFRTITCLFSTEYPNVIINLFLTFPNNCLLQSSPTFHQNFVYNYL
ncbi:recombinase family protein [Clostridium tagluense]|uniref:recombinase family protein n=1 Tax=Clostridium tagluense TaxID=360422 RepID=UPI001CF23DCE|nr:recombinase family protein [Clostridium tagluense]MCB2298889.1 recombinase family protein [Clostridium tagluense]